MSDPIVRVVDAQEADLAYLAGLISSAFQDLAVCEYLIPDPTERIDRQARHLRQIVTHAHRHGHVHTLQDLSGVAVWLPGGSPIPDIDGYAEKRAEFLGPYTDAYTVFEDAMHHHHPARPPHGHLALLTVEPERQGRGYGSALLRHMHETLDALRMPAYLEASSERSRALYLRNGYLACGDAYLVGPGGPPMHPLWRQPGGSASLPWRRQP